MHGRGGDGDHLDGGEKGGHVVMGRRAERSGQGLGPRQIDIEHRDQVDAGQFDIFLGVIAAEHAGADNTGLKDGGFKGGGFKDRLGHARCLNRFARARKHWSRAPGRAKQMFERQ